MKKLLVLLPIILFSCSQDERFPSTSYGKAMQCVDSNYYAMERKTGETSNGMREKVTKFCASKFSVPISTENYKGKGRASLNNDYNFLELSVTSLSPTTEELGFNHILTRIDYRVKINGERTSSTADGGCYESTILFYATQHIEKFSPDNSYSAELYPKDKSGNNLSDLMKKDQCLEAWVNGLDLKTGSKFPNNKWNWNITKMEGLAFDS